jgi:hypothetical protein
MTIGLFQNIMERNRIRLGLRKTWLPPWLTWASDLTRISQEWDDRARQIPVVTAVSPTLLPEPKDLGFFKHEWVIQPGAMSLSAEESGFYLPSELVKFKKGTYIDRVNSLLLDQLPFTLATDPCKNSLMFLV